MTAGCAGGHHGDLTPDPAAGVIDGVARAWIVGSGRFDEGEHMLGAGSGPEGEEAMVGVGEGAAAADRDEARVAVRGEDHRRCSITR